MSNPRLYSHPFAGCYCALCDKYFHDQRQRNEHIMNSDKHPECWKCGRRFLNAKVMLQHILTTPGHHYCTTCDKHFRTAAGMRVHKEDVHQDDDEEDYDSDEEDEEPYLSHEEEHERCEGWEDVEGDDLYPDEESEPADPCDDLSFEQDDSCDFEDFEYLRQAPSFTNDDSDDTDEEESDDSEEELPHVCCPLCEETGQNMCATACGHVYCLRCITSVMKHSGECPICDEEICEGQLRRIYISN